MISDLELAEKLYNDNVSWLTKNKDKLISFVIETIKLLPIETFNMRYFGDEHYKQLSEEIDNKIEMSITHKGKNVSDIKGTLRLNDNYFEFNINALKITITDEDDSGRKSIIFEAPTPVVKLLANIFKDEHTEIPAN